MLILDLSLCQRQDARAEGHRGEGEGGEGAFQLVEDEIRLLVVPFVPRRQAWEALPEKASEMDHFTDWDTVVHIDHGYDETKPESQLDRADMVWTPLHEPGELREYPKAVTELEV